MSGWGGGKTPQALVQRQRRQLDATDRTTVERPPTGGEFPMGLYPQPIEEVYRDHGEPYKQYKRPMQHPYMVIYSLTAFCLKGWIADIRVKGF